MLAIGLEISRFRVESRELEVGCELQPAKTSGSLRPPRYTYEASGAKRSDLQLRGTVAGCELKISAIYRFRGLEDREVVGC